MTDWIFWAATFALLICCMAMWEYIASLKDELAANRRDQLPAVVADVVGQVNPAP